MKLINSLSDLYDAIAESADNEWVYVNLATWSSKPEDCPFYIIPEAEIDEMSDDEIYESEAGPYLPIQLRHLNLWPWMEIGTLQGVIQNLNMGNKTDFNADLFVKGINYYREHDDFWDA